MSERRYAVLVASSRYPDEVNLQDLRCPENDVDRLNETLTASLHGNFTETIVLKNRPHHEILRNINKVLKRAGKKDVVLIYYSGHGKLDPAGRLHLASVDTTVDTLEATSIPVQSIRNYVDVSSSRKVVLILDCCFSGAVEKAFLRSGVDDQLQLASGGRGTFIMTASTGIQAAQEKESDQNAVFTKHIIEGIEKGEADINGDGQVDMDELYRYVHDRVLDEGFQEPMKWDLNVRGELVIARSGKVPREERRKEIRGMLLDLAGKGLLPDGILARSFEVIAMKPAQLSGELRSYDALLDQLLQKHVRVGEFIEQWYKVELGSRSTKVEPQVASPPAKPSAAVQPPIPKPHPPPVSLSPRGTKKLSKGFYLGSIAVGLGLGVLLTIVGYIMLWAGEADAGEMLLIAFIPMFFGGIIFAVLIYKMWKSIQDGHARTSPGKAIGFMLIPFYNFYWSFQILWGFSKDYNSFVDRHSLSAAKLPEGLFLTYNILNLTGWITGWIPGIGQLLIAINYVIGLVVVSKICDGVNALPQITR